MPCGYVGSGLSNVKHRMRVASERFYIQELQRAVTVGSALQVRSNGKLGRTRNCDFPY